MKLFRIHHLIFLFFLLLVFCMPEGQGSLYLSDIEIEVTGVEGDEGGADGASFFAGSGSPLGGGKDCCLYGAAPQQPERNLGSGVFAGVDRVILSVKRFPYYIFYCSLKIPFS